MNAIKIIISYLLGLIIIHILLYFDYCQIIPMILSMGFGVDENLSEAIYIYVGGGIITYLSYFLFTFKKLDKLLLYSWIAIGMIIVLCWSDSFYKILDLYFENSFIKPVYNIYYAHHYAKDTFVLIFLYIVYQLSAYLLYLLIKNLIRLIMSKKNE